MSTSNKVDLRRYIDACIEFETQMYLVTSIVNLTTRFIAKRDKSIRKSVREAASMQPPNCSAPVSDWAEVLSPVVMGAMGIVGAIIGYFVAGSICQGASMGTTLLIYAVSLLVGVALFSFMGFLVSLVLPDAWKERKEIRVETARQNEYRSAVSKSAEVWRSTSDELRQYIEKLHSLRSEIVKSLACLYALNILPAGNLNLRSLCVASELIHAGYYCDVESLIRGLSGEITARAVKSKLQAPCESHDFNAQAEPVLNRCMNEVKESIVKAKRILIKAEDSRRWSDGTAQKDMEELIKMIEARYEGLVAAQKDLLSLAGDQPQINDTAAAIRSEWPLEII